MTHTLVGVLRPNPDNAAEIPSRRVAKRVVRDLAANLARHSTGTNVHRVGRRSTEPRPSDRAQAPHRSPTAHPEQP